MAARLSVLAVLASLLAANSASAASCTASWYDEGALTATGAPFLPDGLTAASPGLPFGTRVLVSLGSRSVTVTVNDRGPAAWTGRCIDLSRGAARQLGMLDQGVAVVRMEIVR